MVWLKSLPNTEVKGKMSSPSRSIVNSIIFIAVAIIFIVGTGGDTARCVPGKTKSIINNELVFLGGLINGPMAGHRYQTTRYSVTPRRMGNAHLLAAALDFRRFPPVLLLRGISNRWRRSHRHLRLTPSFCASSVSLIESWCSSTKRWK